MEGIRPLRFCGKVAPVFVHPEPGRRVRSYVRFERVPARLCDLLMRHLSGTRDLGMEYEAVTSIWQRLAVRGNDRRACLFMQPGMRRCNAGFQSKTVYRHGAKAGWRR